MSLVLLQSVSADRHYHFAIHHPSCPPQIVVGSPVPAEGVVRRCAMKVVSNLQDVVGLGFVNEAIGCLRAVVR